MTMMVEFLMKGLSDAGSTPARSIKNQERRRKMLDQKDIEMLKGLLDANTEKMLEESAQKTEKMFEASAKQTKKMLDALEHSLIEEIGRTQITLENQIAELKENVDYLQQYYNITKLENDNTTLLLQIVTEIQERITELEKKIA